MTPDDLQKNLPTPIKVSTLSKRLEGYDPVKARYLTEDFTFKFSLDFQGPSLNK
jgi:hypothetical protein